MNAGEIYDIIQDNRHYSYFGLRAQTKNPITGKFEILNVGDCPACSYVWDDGSPTDYELDGTSALMISVNADEDEVQDVINKIAMYDDRAQVVLLASYRMQWGDDEGEIVMYDSLTVLAEWKK